MVLAQAAIPGASGLSMLPAVDALQTDPDVPSSLITMDVGTAGVRVLLIKSLRAERETRAFGVTGQEQHDIICSSGENAYTFTHMFPVVTGAAFLGATPLSKMMISAGPAPVFVMLTTESPMAKLDA